MTHNLSPDCEHYLKQLYLCEREADETALRKPGDRVAGDLLRERLVEVAGSDYRLTKEGMRQAEKVVRRHRLAERLLHDVVDVKAQLADRAACEFEHSLFRGLEEQVCTLLAHPTTCPHGRPIPPGRCCKERKRSSSPAILPLSEMKAGDGGSVAYLASKQADIVQKLMVMGVLPGATLRVIQTYPCVALQVGQTQMAIDPALAREVYVRRISDEDSGRG